MNNPLNTNDQFSLGMMNPNPKSSKTAKGPVYRVSFELEQADWQMFMDASTAGMVLACVMSVVPDTGQAEESGRPDPAPATKGPFGEFAQHLMKVGFLRVPALWAALGTEAAHKAWIQDKPCFICGGGDFSEKHARLMCEQAHVRRSGEAGTGYKPPYISVPLCHHHHQVSHEHGESALSVAYQVKHHNESGSIRDIMSEAAIRYVSAWAKEKIYEKYNIPSLTYLSPRLFAEFVEQNDIPINVPEKYLK